jgi:hypothetical protein
MIYKVSSTHQQQATDARVCDEERDAKFVATSLSLSQVVCVRHQRSVAGIDHDL